MGADQLLRLGIQNRCHSHDQICLYSRLTLQIMKKSVTLEGDSFDPAGTLTGGSRPQSSGILSKLTDIQDMSSQLQRKKKELTDIDAELQKLKKVPSVI